MPTRDVEATKPAPGRQTPASTRAEFLRIVRSSFLYFFAQAGARIIGFFYILFIARVLPVDDFGYLNLALAIVVVADTVADLGLSRLIVRELSQDASRTPRYLGALLPLRIIASLLIYAAVLGYVWLASYPGAMMQIAVVAGLGLLFIGPSMMTESALQAHQKFRLISLAHMALGLIQAASGVAAILLGGGVIAIAATFSLSNLVYLVILGGGLRRANHVIRPILDRAFWRDCLRSSLPYGGMAVIFVLSMRIELLMLGWLSDAAALAVYGVALRFVEAVLLVAITFGTVLAPNFARHQFEPGKRADLYFMAMRVALLLSIPAALFGAAISGPVIALLLPGKYDAAGDLLPVMLIGFPFAAVYYLNLALMFATRDQRPTLIMTIGLSIAQIIVNAWLIPRFGAVGAAAAFSVAAGVNGLVAAACAARWFELGAYRVLRAIAPPAAGGLVMAGVISMFGSIDARATAAGLASYGLTVAIFFARRLSRFSVAS